MPSIPKATPKAKPTPGPYGLCVAPMMRYTDRHCRVFHRLLAPRAGLYTEMVVADALLHGNGDRLLAFSDREHPVALQIGGHKPDVLARAAHKAWQAGFDEVNLNVGCPSDRVRQGTFGACLMLEPERVADAAAAMQAAVPIPVTVKCRLGIDGHDHYAFLRDFVGTVAEAGVSVFMVHARIAVLTGLSPAQNREVPPLLYERVARLAAEFPRLTIVLNGGLATTDAVMDALRFCDGVMIGRAAYHDPYWFAQLHAQLSGQLSGQATPQRHEFLNSYACYMESELRTGTPLMPMLRPLMGLYNGMPGARTYRRILSERGRQAGAGIEVLREAQAAVHPPCDPMQTHATLREGASC